MSRQARLLELLRSRSFQRKRVVLASGKESDFFIDCKQTVLSAEGHALVGPLMLEAIRRLPAVAKGVAGVELGGCPLASAVSFASFEAGDPLDAIYVRKEAKEHGSRRLLEGDSGMPKGAAIAIVEDVITTGGSTLRAIEKLVAAGYTIAGVVALVDRLEGGRAALVEAGHAVSALYTRKDFIDDSSG